VLTARFTVASSAIATNTLVATPTTTNGVPVPPKTNTITSATASPAVTVTKTLLSPTGRPIVVGDTVTYRIAVTNTGDLRLDTLPLTDTYNTGLLRYTNAVPLPTTPVDGSLYWANIGPLNPGAGTVVLVDLKAVGGGSGVNRASVAPTTTNGVPVRPVTNSVPFEVMVKLTIVSAHGTGTPPAGVYTNLYGTVLTNRMTGLDWPGNGGTQYVATGWTMTGNGPASGSGTNMTMTLTNNAVLTWLWQTNYMLQLSTSPSGVTNAITGATAGFKPADATYNLTPVPAFGYGFDHWIVNGQAFGAGEPLPVTMDGAKSVVAVFVPIFVDVTSQLDWRINWVFNPRTGTFFGSLFLSNRADSAKALLAPIWYEVQSNEWHWLRFPSGFDTNTGLYYTNVSYALTNQLPGGDTRLDPGESITVTGIELMGRRTPTGLVVAVWADPPAAQADSDGDGVPDASEYIAGTSAVDRNSVFRIRPAPDGRGVEWDGLPSRVYNVLVSTNLASGFAPVSGDLAGTGPAMRYHGAPQALGGDPPVLFYRVQVRLKEISQ
jgi:uncharacterized repeat protein (TIGR01451 family)